MEKAIVLGATGGTGQAIVSELLSRNKQVIAFGRSEKKLKQLMKEHHSTALLTYKLGDVFDYKTIVEAAKDADVIFQCANVQYHEMAEKLLLLGESVMKAANILGKKIVIV
ncbi:SDR family NAD(P)-dependent oxidoreductase, partial [Klebsiella pneumoniae]|nr:SDR family NAD(P)-dependent oxidoreductase [Klebsiella pneumoniae]